MADSTGPAIPSVPLTDPATSQFLNTLKENVELFNKNRNSQTLTIANQVTAALAAQTSTASSIILLSNYAAVVPADSSGVVTSFAAANGILKVYAGGQDVTPQCTLSVLSATGCTGTVNNVLNTPAAGPKGYYQVTAMSATNASLVLQAIFGTLTLQTIFGLTKSLAGATGPPGTGAGALSLQLTNDAIVLPAYANGAVITFGTAVGLARFFNGSSEVTNSTTFSANAINCTGTVNTAANTPVAGQPMGYYQVTAMSAATGTLAITGVYSGVSLTQVVNITLAKGGYEIVSAMPSTNLFQGRIVFYTLDNKLYRYDGAAWVTWVQASDITGQINAAQIQDGVITTAKLLPGLSPVILVTALPAPGIAGRIVYLTADSQLYRDTGVVWTTSILAGSIQGQIPGSQLAANSITAGQIQAGAITTNALLANSISGDRISAGTLDASKIAALSITAAQIQANAVTSVSMAANSITGDRIQAGTLDAAKIASTSITAVQIAAGTITGAEIHGGTITADKIATGTITAASALLANAAVGTLQLAGQAVTIPVSATQASAYTVPGSFISQAAIGQLNPNPANAIWYTLVTAPAVVSDGTFPFLIQGMLGNLQAFSAAALLVVYIYRLTAPLSVGSVAAGARGGNFQAPVMLAAQSTPITILWMDSPPAGTYYYALAGASGGPSTKSLFAPPSIVSNCVLTVLGVKR